MALHDDLTAEVKAIFNYQWPIKEMESVPEPDEFKLSDEAVYLHKPKHPCVLYADLDGSTNLVDSSEWWFAGEIYKTFLNCATRLIKAEGGAITSYDGDRVMGIFLSEAPCTAAARCALKISYAVQNIINPALLKRYPEKSYEVRHVIGIDQSEIRAARAGVRGDNDIVWIGRAPNYAAKLTSLSSETPVWITERVYDHMLDVSKFSSQGRTNMWLPAQWSDMDNMKIYCSSWRWEI